VESRHHEDLRRDLVVTQLQAVLRSWPSTEAIDAQLWELRAQRRNAEDNNDLAAEELLSAQIGALNRARAGVGEDGVLIGDILEDARTVTEYSGARGTRQPLKPLIRAFVELGVQPQAAKTLGVAVPPALPPVTGGRKVLLSLGFSRSGLNEL
jgi:DEAD/DEAH box helicase domain-containing protein